jgi:hypothetical protein
LRSPDDAAGHRIAQGDPQKEVSMKARLITFLPVFVAVAAALPLAAGRWG